MEPLGKLKVNLLPDTRVTCFDLCIYFPHLQVSEPLVPGRGSGHGVGGPSREGKPLESCRDTPWARGLCETGRDTRGGPGCPGVCRELPSPPLRIHCRKSP